MQLGAASLSTHNKIDGVLPKIIHFLLGKDVELLSGIGCALFGSRRSMYRCVVG